MNVSSLFFQTAAVKPDATAIVYEGERWSFEAFERDVRSTAAYFASKGLKAGDRVLVFVPMSVDLYRVVMAIFQLGATAVFLDEWVSLDRLRICCRVADCRAFIAPLRFRMIGWFIPEIRKIPLHLKAGATATPPLKDVYPSLPEDVALLTFTTGSTGLPKAARRTHHFLKCQFDALIREMEPAPGDVVMTNLPIVMLINFGTGATSVIARFNAKKPWKTDPGKIIRQISEAGVNILIASPYFALRLCETDLKIPLKKVFTGGGPVFPAEAGRLQAAFTGAHIRIVYGSTEAEPVATVDAVESYSHNDLAKDGGLCVGDPDPGISLAIISMTEGPVTGDQLPEFQCPTGVVGEIIVMGNHVLKEYWNNPEAFKINKIVDENGRIWHRTGDAGFIGEVGKLYLTGRVKQMIRRNERWISPFLAEGLLRGVPGLIAGTVIEKEGKLLAVIEKGREASDIEDNVRNALPFEVDEVRIIGKMPRDPRHFTKIDYDKLNLSV